MDLLRVGVGLGTRYVGQALRHPLNILQVSPYAPPMSGGSEAFCFGLSRQLHKRGHNITVWTSRLPRSGLKIDYSEGFPVKRFFCIVYALNVNPAFFIIPDVLRAVEGFDIVHSHSYIYFCANQLALCRKMRNFRFILHLHGGLGDVTDPFRRPLKKLYDRTLARFTMRMADKMISVSSADARTAVTRFGADKEKIVSIPNAVDTSRFHLTQPCNPLTATFIGRLVQWKGCEQMPAIFKKLMRIGIHIRVVGDGPYLQLLKRTCPTVEFTGHIPPTDIPRILNQTNVLMLPSFLEGMPTVCIEAMASGVPSVAYDVGGVSEVVRNGVTGYTVKVGDVNAFVARISQLIKDEAKWNTMSKRCFDIARKEYDWSIVTDRIEKEYARLV